MSTLAQRKRGRRAPVTRLLRAKIWAPAKGHFYVEPADCSAALFRVEAFPGGIWDPACGQGNILRSAQAAGLPAVGTDLADRVAEVPRPGWWGGEKDFLAVEAAPAAPHLVFNPPFGRGKLAEAFIRHALHLAGGRRKVAAFVEARFVFGEKRAKGLYRDHPPSRVYVVSPRPSCPPGAYLAGGGKAEGGKADYVWLVWDPLSLTGDTSLRWLVREERAA